jgi:hypothetical protein
MYDPEPRFVPPLPTPYEEIIADKFYCLECGNSFTTEYAAATHWKSLHAPESEAIPGHDFVRGTQYRLMRDRRIDWIERSAARFVKDLHPGFGAEDFVAEAEIREA